MKNLADGNLHRRALEHRGGDLEDQTPSSIASFREALLAQAAIVGVNVEGRPLREGARVVEEAILALERGELVDEAPVGTAAVPGPDAQERARTKMEQLAALVAVRQVHPDQASGSIGSGVPITFPSDGFVTHGSARGRLAAHSHIDPFSNR